jgi:hypothetical protein
MFSRHSAAELADTLAELQVWSILRYPLKVEVNCLYTARKGGGGVTLTLNFEFENCRKEIIEFFEADNKCCKTPELLP